MGLVYVHAVVEGPRGRRKRLRLLVDSGAAYTVLPESIWKAIGLKPRRTMSFSLADGTEVVRAVSDCRIQFDGHEGPTPVVLGKRDDEPLLGVVALGNLGLVLNPFSRRLQPMRAMLAATR